MRRLFGAFYPGLFWGAVVADPRAGVAEGFPFFRKELPRIALGQKGQLQDSVGADIAHFAVGHSQPQRIMTAAARAYDNLANAVPRVGSSVRVLGSEPFIGMLMARKHQVGVNGVQIVPQRLQFGVDGMASEETTTEQRVMSIGDDASTLMLAQILPKPDFLRRTRRATT